jgi:predicted MFS family arabinose efflux permease
MNEPSLFALLMNRVTPPTRSGASSLMFITMSVASTIAAPVAGRAISHLGYTACLAIAALVAACAAFLFFRLPNFASDLHKTNNS